jgi:hypothetical protein
LKGIVRQQVAHRLQSDAEAGDDLRPVARKCLRHVLVGSALPRPFGIELGIGLIGLGQGLRECLGPSRGSGETQRRGHSETERGGGKTDASCRAKTNARSKHAPCHVANFSGTPNHVIPQATPAVRSRRRPRHIYLFRGRCGHRQTVERETPMNSVLRCCRFVTAEYRAQNALSCRWHRPIPAVGCPNRARYGARLVLYLAGATIRRMRSPTGSCSPACASR